MKEALSFGEQEFADIRLKDRRLEKRFRSVMSKFLKAPSLSINGSMENWSEAKSAYRLFSNPQLTEEKILHSHQQALFQRAKSHQEVLVIQDTSKLVFTTRHHTEGLGSIADGAFGFRSKGLFMHTNYAVSSSGVPLGILHQLTWSRAQLKEGDPLWNSENYKWLASLEESARLKKFLGPNSSVIHVCDREGDFWELLAEIERRHCSFVIRAMKYKNISAMCENNARVLGNLTMEIEFNLPGKGGNYAGNFWKEQVQLAVQTLELDLKKTKYFTVKNRPKDLRVFVVWIKEIGTPKNREPLEWVLKTNIPVENLDQALRIINIYKTRWIIEIFHKALKSGANVEKARLASADRLKKYVMAMSVVAWKLHSITLASRDHPDEPCTIALSETQWQTLYIKIKNKKPDPKSPPTLKQAVRWTAMLGGFLARKSDGDPGILTLWRGWERLTELAEFHDTYCSLQQTCG